MRTRMVGTSYKIFFPESSNFQGVIKVYLIIGA